MTKLILQCNKCTKDCLTLIGLLGFIQSNPFVVICDKCLPVSVLKPLEELGSSVVAKGEVK